MSEHEKAIRLAGQALHQGLDSKWESATRYVVRIGDECGGDGLMVALVAWCDTYIAHATDGQMSPARSRISFIRTDTGGLDRPGSPDVPARIQWAGQLIQARAGMDEPKWKTLIEELPDDSREIGSYVTAVLETVALTINGLPRGFARMGRST